LHREACKRKCSARLAVQPCGFSTAPWFWRRGKNPHRWKSRRAGGRALRYRLKALANQRDVPYQSLLKVLLAERLKQEEATQLLTLRPAQSLP